MRILFSVFTLLLVFTVEAADFVVKPNATATTRKSLQLDVPIQNQSCESEVVYQQSNGQIKYYYTTVQTSQGPVRVPVECVAAGDTNPPPTTPPPPTGQQTPDSIAAAGQVIVSFKDPTTNETLEHIIKGRIRFVTPAGCANRPCDGTVAKPFSPSQIFIDSKPGDVYVFRAGEYRQNYGGNWGQRNFALGPGQSGIALVGMPGETAKLIRPVQNGHGNIILANGNAVANVASNAAHNVTIANLHFVGGGEAISGGGFWEAEESGARNATVVANNITADYTTNTMTGLVATQGDGWKIWGNAFHDFGTTPPIKNNHAIYVQTGADNTEIAHNSFLNLKIGHVIQVHTDGTQRLSQGTLIRRNYLKGANAQDMRGITFSNIAGGSTGRVEGNLLENLGQDFSALAVYCGSIEFVDNRLTNIAGGSSGKVWLSGQAGCSPILKRRGNIIQGGTGMDYSVDGVPAGNIQDF